MYRDGLEPNSESTRRFRQSLFSYISHKVVPAYKDEVTEDQHYRQLDNLVAFANGAGNQVLGPRGYKYGVAQKLLNLFLKYQWCLDMIAEPPHCPVDRIVIDQTRYKGKINWTDIVERPQYQRIIEDIRCQARNQSIAMWELSIYNRR